LTALLLLVISLVIVLAAQSHSKQFTQCCYACRPPRDANVATSSNHLILGLPVIRLPTVFHSKILFTIFEESILCMWPNHPILWALITLTISAPLIRRSSLALLHILQVLSPVRSGPNIFLKISLSRIGLWGLFLSCS
jgi:hypothetical protein